MGVVSYNKTAYNANHYTLFPLRPPLMNLEARWYDSFGLYSIISNYSIVHHSVSHYNINIQ